MEGRGSPASQSQPDNGHNLGADPGALAALERRLEALERALPDLGASLQGHAAWLADLQRGMGDVVHELGSEGSSNQVADLRRQHEHVAEWLGTLERWVRSCMGTLAEFGAQPVLGEAPGAGPVPDVLGAVRSQLQVWVVMGWIRDVGQISEPAQVSVVMATSHARPQMLLQAVGSVLGQSCAAHELIVVDDSPDQRVDAALNSLRDGRIRVLHSETPGQGRLGAALNVGLRAVRGRMVTVLDDDNVLHREWLRSVTWAFEQRPEISSLYGARLVEDRAASHGQRSGELPSLDFLQYDRRRHERANFIDQNTIAFRRGLVDVEYDEELSACVDWDRSLRLFDGAPPLALPAIACYYRTLHAGRVSDRPEVVACAEIVRRRAYARRPLRVHVHTAMYPVISESYIGEDIQSLEDCGATVTVSSFQEAVSRDPDAPPARLDVDDALLDAQPDVVLMHWATHAHASLPLMERHGLPFACRVHTFDVDRDAVSSLLEHPLCVGVYAHPHHLHLLPDAVQPLLPVVGPRTSIPAPAPARDLVLSVSAGLPKKQFPLLIDAMARLPEYERLIVLARTNGVLELPEQVQALAAACDPPVPVRINVPRSEVLGAMARAGVLLYTLADDAQMGFPMAIVEAMLCGTIVIAPDRPEAHEIVGEHLRAYRTPEDIERHVREVMRGGPHVEAAREALRERAARHRDPLERQRLHDSLRERLMARTLATA